MPSEAGDMKLLGNFSKLIEFISTDSNYHPANAKIKVPAPTTPKTTALAAVAQVGNNEATFKSVTNEGQEAYEGLPLARRGCLVARRGFDIAYDRSQVARRGCKVAQPQYGIARPKREVERTRVSPRTTPTLSFPGDTTEVA